MNRRPSDIVRRVRSMGDAVDVAALPEGLDLYLTYLDGRVTSGHRAAMIARFGVAIEPRLVGVTVTGQNLDAPVADVERYDLTPLAGAVWARRKRALGRTPTLYCSASAWPTVQQAVRAEDLDPWADVCWLIADYNDQPVIPPHAIGHQYSSTSYDRSVVADFWPGVDHGEDAMVTIWSDGKRLAGYSAATGMRHLTPWEWRTLTSVPQLRAQVANPTQPWEISPGDLDAALAWKDRAA